MMKISISQKRAFLSIQNNEQKLSARNIAPLIARIEVLRESLGKETFKIDFGDTVSVDFGDSRESSESKFSRESLGDSSDSSFDSSDSRESLRDLLFALKPWRKGPFRIFDTLIDSEWNSAIKFNLIAPYLQVRDKSIADIGANNGYYAFRLIPLSPKSITIFEPSAQSYAQFCLLNAFIQSQIDFKLLGLEDLARVGAKFDCILCLGVLYHRTNPINCLKILKNALNKGGFAILDTLIIQDSREIVLSPRIYAKMKNVYFIPSISAFQNWLNRAGFRDIELIATKKTTQNEQRKTAWSGGESLGDFLDKNDSNKTIEGHPAPIRAYFRVGI